MKIIECPVDVKGEVEGGTFEAKFTDFLRISLDSYEALGKGLAQVRQAIKIHAVVDKIEAGKPIQFEDADFAVVRAAVEAMKWKPGYARRVLPFYEAVENAQEVKT